jgi:cytochrome c peroxidase
MADGNVKVVIRSVKYLLPAVFFILVWTLSAGFDKKKDGTRFIRPQGWPRPEYDFSKNKITDAGFKLGRKLFYDPILSRDSSTSCASCHTQWSGFTHVDHAVSHGIKGLKGKHNSLTLFNLAWNKSFMWDGGVNNLEVQPLAPITNAVEMDNTLENIVKTLDTAKGYKLRFYQAFGDSAITGQRVLKAIAQFIVTFESFNSRYDKYVRGEVGGDMNKQELNGLKLFRKNCESCHKEPLFTDYSFRNAGLAVDTELNDIGRMGITRDPGDSLKFRVPSLRNVAMSYPYMHDGRFKTIRQVLDHYTGSIVQSPTLAAEFRKPMVLNDSDKTDIVAFLLTLTDDDFLQDTSLRDKRE